MDVARVGHALWCQLVGLKARGVDVDRKETPDVVQGHEIQQIRARWALSGLIRLTSPSERSLPYHKGLSIDSMVHVVASVSGPYVLGFRMKPLVLRVSAFFWMAHMNCNVGAEPSRPLCRSFYPSIPLSPATLSCPFASLSIDVCAYSCVLVSVCLMRSRR